MTGKFSFLLYQYQSKVEFKVAMKLETELNGGQAILDHYKDKQKAISNGGIDKLLFTLVKFLF